MLHNSQSGEPSAATHIQNYHIPIVEVSRLEGFIPHVLCPVAWVYNVVVHDGQEPVEPEGLLLVLYEPGLRGGPGGRQAAFRH